MDNIKSILRHFRSGLRFAFTYYGLKKNEASQTMKSIVHIVVILSLLMPTHYARSEATDELIGISNNRSSFYKTAASIEDPVASQLQLLDELNRYANRRVPQLSALDSLFNKKLSRVTIDQIMNDGNGNKMPVKIETISPNGVMTPEEKRRFFRLLENEGKTVKDIESGKFEVIFYHPEDIQRAQMAREVRLSMGKDVLLVEVPESMAKYFSEIAAEAERSYFSRTFHSIARNIKNGLIFVKDVAWSATTASLKGEFKKYIDTVYIRPTQKDDRMAVIFTGIQGAFSSTVFWGLNMDPTAFMGFLSTGLFTTIILSRYWRTINGILKTDIRNPFKYTSTWREVFARVLVIGGSLTTAQFAMGSHLDALKYLPTVPVAVGNALTIGLGEAIYSTQRNRLLTPEAATVIALYSYVLLSLPSRAMAQYAESINISGNIAADRFMQIWSMMRNFHVDFGFMEFTGVSLFVFGSFLVFTKILKHKVHATEMIARDGFFNYLWKYKIKRDKPAETHNLRRLEPRKKRIEPYISPEFLDNLSFEAQKLSTCQAYWN